MHHRAASLVRHSLTALALATATLAAQAAPQADIHELAQKQQQPYLDTLKDLVHIESGSKDMEGTKQIADYVAGKLRALGGKVEVLPANDV